MLAELVFTVCAYTSLICADISIDQVDLNPRVSSPYVDEIVVARAYMTVSGGLGIWFDESALGSDIEYIKGVIVHELAHLEVFVDNYRLPEHGHTFKKRCYDLARKVNVSPFTSCSATGF